MNAEKEFDMTAGIYMAIDETYDYSTETLLQIDEKTIIKEEEEAMTYLNTFWQSMESTLRGYPTVDPNDFRTLFRRGKELIIMPTIRSGAVEDLVSSVESAIGGIIQKGDYVLLLFASTESDWRQEGIQYQDFREAINNSFGKRIRVIFGSAIPDEKQPYTQPLQVSILILHGSENSHAGLLQDSGSITGRI